MKKSIKIISTSVVFIVFFLLSYNFSLAAGCCIKDVEINGKDNCTDDVKDDATCKALDGKNIVFMNYTKCESTQYCSNNDSGKPTASISAFATNTPTIFANPLTYNTLSEVLVAVLVNLQSFLALIAIIIIIIGGMMYMFSAGSEKMIERAKSTIGGALIGLAIILAAPSFLKQIKLVLSGNITGTNADQIVSQAYSFKDIAISVINFLLSIIGILGIIALVIGGVMYVTAYGNEERVESGKKIITNALIGILIAFGALILVKQVAALLGAG